MQKTAFSGFCLVLIFGGCTQSRVAQNGARPNYFRDRVTYTGSHIPQPKERVTYDPLAANAPSESVARNTPSLYPTDPVVGANAGPRGTGPDTGPNPNVGAGPAGSNPLPSSN